jgi:hypothetical protein
MFTVFTPGLLYRAFITPPQQHVTLDSPSIEFLVTSISTPHSLFWQRNRCPFRSIIIHPLRESFTRDLMFQVRAMKALRILLGFLSRRTPERT